MNETYLLDTAIASLVAQGNPVLTAKLDAARKVYVSEIVYGELCFGAYGYARLHSSTRVLDLYEQFAAAERYELIRGDLDTARIYGAIRAELDAKAQPIQLNDIWIAALARQHDLILLTRDGDTARASGLSFELV